MHTFTFGLINQTKSQAKIVGLDFYHYYCYILLGKAEIRQRLHLLNLLVGFNAVKPGQHWTFVISGTSSIEFTCEEKKIFKSCKNSQIRISGFFLLLLYMIPVLKSSFYTDQIFHVI